VELIRFFYRQMVLIRKFELLVLDLFAQNKLAGTVHVCIGQEANAVGVVNALDRDRDVIWSNHRAHGHFIAYCQEVEGLLAEIMGLPAGICGGRGGTQHLSFNRFFSNGIQGGIVPVALGSALALKDTGAITTVFLGDGTMGQGVLYEGLNMAALWNLPVLFVVEDNGIAQTTPVKSGVSGRISNRAKPFGIKSFRYAGTNVLDVYKLASEVISYIRTERKPAWLYLKTVRLGPHSKGDDTRSDEEMLKENKKDPLLIFRKEISDWSSIEQKCEQDVLEVLRKVTCV